MAKDIAHCAQAKMAQGSLKNPMNTKGSINPTNSKTPGLYIHIPFCLSKCSYCDFYSTTSISAVGDFLEALFKEMEMYRYQFNPVDTVYIGGGTPSLLSPEQLEEILARVRTGFNMTRTPEITIETNPADLNRYFLESILTIGINRINIGVQSFDENVLDFLGRRHSVQEGITAVEAARKAGFTNIGFDLIYCVPEQGIESWIETIRQAIGFSPEHLSCYQLTLEPKTPLGRRYQSGEFAIPGETEQYEFFVKTAEILEEAGYMHYEVSNFSRGKELASRHNQKYWDHSPYLGLGPSAHSFRSNQRWWNHSSLGRYLAAISEGNFPVENKESLTMEQLQLEALCLGLRTREGVSLQEFKDRYHYDLLAQKRELLVKLEEEGFISIQGGVVSPTQTGLALADSLSLI